MESDMITGERGGMRVRGEMKWGENKWGKGGKKEKKKEDNQMLSAST